MCPICKKSLGDYSRYWRAIDEQIARHPNPPEYLGWRADTMCNDCSELGGWEGRRVGVRRGVPSCSLCPVSPLLLKPA